MNHEWCFFAPLNYFYWRLHSFDKVGRCLDFLRRLTTFLCSCYFLLRWSWTTMMLKPIQSQKVHRLAQWKQAAVLTVLKYNVFWWLVDFQGDHKWWRSEPKIRRIYWIFYLNYSLLMSRTIMYWVLIGKFYYPWLEILKNSNDFSTELGTSLSCDYLLVVESCWNL